LDTLINSPPPIDPETLSIIVTVRTSEGGTVSVDQEVAEDRKAALPISGKN
jgi:hypothetical protein